MDLTNIHLQEFAEVTKIIRDTQQQVFRLANTALIDLYWNIGAYLTSKIESAKWGDGVVSQLANYIARELPGQRGFSNKNLWRMKQFYETYRGSEEIVSTLLRQISWSHNCMIISRCKSQEERSYYLELCLNERLSFRQLERQIDCALYERSKSTEPKLSPLMKEIVSSTPTVFRDQYVLEFVGGKAYSNENSLKDALIKQMKDFILELGSDFIYINKEYRLQVGNSDFRIDLLFYHRELQCLVAFEIKMGKFEPSHLGQLNFYLEALDRDVKKPHENPSIGVLLCKDKDDEVVEYALSRSLSPTMVAQYQLCMPDKTKLQSKMREIENQMKEIF